MGVFSCRGRDKQIQLISSSSSTAEITRATSAVVHIIIISSRVSRYHDNGWKLFFYELFYEGQEEDTVINLLLIVWIDKRDLPGIILISLE